MESNKRAEGRMNLTRIDHRYYNNIPYKYGYTPGTLKGHNILLESLFTPFTNALTEMPIMGI